MRGVHLVGVVFVLLVTLTGCAQNTMTDSTKTANQGTSATTTEKVATFAGGCFWCMEPPFEQLDGVTAVLSGYTGGTNADPTYEEVSSGATGHLEAIQVHYDPTKVTYRELVEVFWKQIDPTDDAGQFADRGTQYKTAIFYANEEERQAAEASKAALEASGKFDKPIVTALLPAQPFYKAEEYHQDYYKKNALRYELYKKGSGRAAFIEENWAKDADGDGFSKPSETELKLRLTPEQYHVTQENGTEKPFENAYWDEHRDGIYVDVVSGEPLFSSRDKYESGTGWPSFTKPLEAANVVTKRDWKLIIPRTEVRSKQGDSHLGHVFNDGPEPTGLRYCMNSAALRFIPKEDLEKEGYGAYLSLFDNQYQKRANPADE